MLTCHHYNTMPNYSPVSSFQYAPVPDRATLHQRFQAAQRYAVYGEFALWGLLLVCLFGIDWSAAYRDALHSMIVLAVFPIQLLPGLIKTLTKKKKRIDELSESTRFGVFDKHLLRRTTQEVLDKLGISKEHVNVFVTADKEMNAFAVNVGLSRFFPQFRGVYLNRQTLHLMSPDELRSWIGHELGHLFQYAIRADQSIGLRLIVGSLLPLLVFQWVGFRNGYGFMAVIAVSWAFLYVTSWTRSRLSQVVEYLCDEVGCVAAGANAAVTDLVRASRESLARFNLLMYVQQLAAEGKIASELDAMRVYEEALGYGTTDIERTQKQIHEVIRQRRQKNGGLSLRGLIDFMWNDPSADSPAAEAREELKQMHRILQRLPTVDWFADSDWDGRSIMRDDQLDDLVEALIKAPDRLLVPLVEEAQADEDLSHPSYRNRIIYLWVHRDAIAKQSLSR
jgi:Zn-dependent protease with chaperone function